MASGFALIFSTSSPAEWVPLIAQYGPAALFVFITIYLVRTRPNAGNRALNATIVALMWGCVFLLVAVIVVAWWKVTFGSEFTIVGTIENLRDPQVITTSEPVYLHKRPKAGKDFEYQWRYISDAKPTGSFELLLQPDPSAAYIYKYTIPFDASFFDGSAVDLSIDQSMMMTLKHESKQQLITGVKDVSSVQVPDVKWTNLGLLPTVRAANEVTSNIQDLIAALDANDPVTRAKAKKDLIDLGAAAIPSLAGALNGNYRTQVEALSTLSQLKKEALDTLPGDAKCDIAQMAKSGDSVIQSEASLVIKAGEFTPGNCRLTPTPSNLKPQGPLNFSLDSRKKWTTTNIQLKPGQQVSITATGTIHWSEDPTNVVGPQGSPTKRNAAKGSLYGPYPVKDFGVGGLVACIGQRTECFDHPRGRAFAIGEHREFRVNGAGELFLGIQDNDVNDNSGRFEVTVVIDR